MKVAIIGGGLAGIVCAAQLEKLGIIPDLYERNDRLAEPYSHTGASLQIVLRPIKDPLVYLREKYDIAMQPSGLVKNIIHIAPHASRTITGNLGYFVHRGAIEDSIENQMARNLKSHIFLNTEVDYRELKKSYDFVVVASGHPMEAQDAGIWKENITMMVKGAVVSGDFPTDTMKVWLNKDFCKAGYAYLAPFNEKQATLALAVDYAKLKDLDSYWAHFLKSESIPYKIEKTFTRIHYSGFVYPHQIDNVYFIGNAGGVLDPLLGFGVFPSVVTASEAAKAIAEGSNFEEAIKNAVLLNRKILEFRKVFNRLQNRHYDLLVKALGLPGVNALIYNTNLNAINLGYLFTKPFNSILDFFEKLKS